VLPGAIFYYPYLERYRDAAGRAARAYRFRARSAHYIPLTAVTGGDVVVQVHPWDDQTPPADVLRRPEPLRMLPRPGAPLGHTPTLRGRVETPAHAPIAGAVVAYDQPNPPRPIRVVSEADGDYALPIRLIAAANLTVTVTAGGPPIPFNFGDWRTDVRTTQNLTL
jgi:hypothetical protein